MSDEWPTPTVGPPAYRPQRRIDPLKAALIIVLVIVALIVGLLWIGGAEAYPISCALRGGTVVHVLGSDVCTADLTTTTTTTTTTTALAVTTPVSAPALPVCSFEQNQDGIETGYRRCVWPDGTMKECFFWGGGDCPSRFIRVYPDALVVDQTLQGIETPTTAMPGLTTPTTAMPGLTAPIG